MIYSLIFAAAALGPGIGASPLMATPPIMARDLSFGSCTNPRVSFNSGAFVPENLVDFPHASVSDPKILFSFICSQLVSKCGLHETDPAVLACLKAAPPAEALGAKGISADTFNAALGFTTDFAAVDKSGPSTGSSAGSPGRSPRDELIRVPPPPKAAPPPVPSPVPPPPVPRKEDSHIHKPAPLPPHAPVPPHRHHPVSGPHSRALRDADVDTKAKGPAPDKDEGENGVKGGTLQARAMAGPLPAIFFAPSASVAPTGARPKPPPGSGLV
ncbi:hypothetical protein BS47DRAFT_598997 [Hydnum rufescens UP504]|uniref:Uncharacterized protein n=1 Tax=Hydnum rufescens UP504 TaxID=1448309 RepID=A0A9P6DN95_9AGAM|nr:hypothetical protein BS47DRAFT_598997 [Hydnum rufescens UP504]